MNSNKVFKFTSVIRRFEPEINGGTYFLYEVQNNEIWTGNYSAKVLLDLIDGFKTVKELRDEFSILVNIFDVNAINNSVDIIFEELIKKKMLIEV